MRGKGGELGAGVGRLLAQGSIRARARAFRDRAECPRGRGGAQGAVGFVFAGLHPRASALSSSSISSLSRTKRSRKESKIESGGEGVETGEPSRVTLEASVSRCRSRTKIGEMGNGDWRQGGKY